MNKPKKFISQEKYIMIIKIQGNDTFSDRQYIRKNLIYN